MPGNGGVAESIMHSPEISAKRARIRLLTMAVWVYHEKRGNYTDDKSSSRERTTVQFENKLQHIIRHIHTVRVSIVTTNRRDDR
jgi:hypothetical protein